MTPQPSGLVVVDKPAGWTSHDVVAKLRGALGTRKVGHAGTLDPDATGVLLVGAGTVTRLLRFLSASSKSYTAEVVLGVATSTLDSSGEVTATYDMGTIDLDDVRRAAAGLTGEILQVPPMVSAVQVGGRRLHELAREGIEVDRDPRPVTVHRFDVAPTEDPAVFAIDVACSAGTYVRSLAADLGRALAGGAHLRRLRRTAAGAFTLEDAHPLDAVVARGPELLLAPAEALRGMSRVTVDDATVGLVRNGRVLPAAELVDGGGPPPWAVLEPGGELLAVYEPHRAGTVKPAVVIPS